MFWLGWAREDSGTRNKEQGTAAQEVTWNGPLIEEIVPPFLKRSEVREAAGGVHWLPKVFFWPATAPGTVRGGPILIAKAPVVLEF